MNIEQEREAFKRHYGALFDLTETLDAWGNPRFAQEFIEAIWYGWRDRAEMQSQDREDAERLDWIEANHGCDIIEFADGTWEVDMPDRPYGVGKGMREAIDHARRIEEEKTCLTKR